MSQGVSNSLSLERDGRVAIVRFGLVGERNSLSRELTRELIDIARGFEVDSETSAIVLAGEGTDFSYGVNLHDSRGDSMRSMAERRVIQRLRPLYIPEVERGMNMSWQSIPRLVLSGRHAPGG